MSNTDNINHPAHYTQHPSGIECIDVVKDMPFCLGCAVKYIWRAGLKDKSKEIEDLQKAIWYLKKQKEVTIPKSKNKIPKMDILSIIKQYNDARGYALYYAIFSMNESSFLHVAIEHLENEIEALNSNNNLKSPEPSEYVPESNMYDEPF